MGKRIIAQRRGSGSTTYTAPSFNYKAKVKYGIFKKIGTICGKIVDIVHCRGHSAPLMKIKYDDETITYLPGYTGAYVGKSFKIHTEKPEKVVAGNAYKIRDLPEGSVVYQVELIPGDGGKLARGSGTKVTIVSHLPNGKTKVLMPSKREKLLHGDCRAIFGIVGGAGREEKPFVKAGVRFFKMKQRNKLYPKTSGSRMSAYDHPWGNSRSLYKGRPLIAPRNAPPGRKVGMLRPKHTGRNK